MSIAVAMCPERFRDYNEDIRQKIPFFRRQFMLDKTLVYKSKIENDQCHYLKNLFKEQLIREFDIKSLPVSYCCPQKF